MDERDLVEAARHGDADAFAVLARQHGDRLYAIANRILTDPGAAQDAAQQALLRAWRDLPTLRDPARFGAWLRQLIVRARAHVPAVAHIQLQLAAAMAQDRLFFARTGVLNAGGVPAGGLWLQTGWASVLTLS